MAQVYGTTGSLSKVLYELKKENITFLNSLDDIISFGNDFENRLFQIKEETRKAVLLERAALRQKLTDLSAEYDTKIKERENILTKEKKEVESLLNHNSINTRNVLLIPYYVYKRFGLQKRKNKLSTNLEKEIKRPFKKLESNISSMKQKLGYIEEYGDKIIEDRAESKSKLLQTAKFIIGENKIALLGAIGEQKALNELKKLPDPFVIINDFQYEFRQWLHNKKSDDWIRSIQADHIVIGPSGVFVIETKNWSSNSIQNIDLYSPVEQIKRTNYVMFLLLNRAVEHNLLSSFGHHWGSRKISVNSIILMVNKKPNQQFQYVTILSLDNLCQYITHSRQVLIDNEVQELANYLLQIHRHY